jgi:hypothetical protein
MDYLPLIVFDSNDSIRHIDYLDPRLALATQKKSRKHEYAKWISW